MDNTLYWIWLTLNPVINPQKITSLLEHFNSIEEIYNADKYTGVPNIGAKEEAVLRNKSLEAAKRVKAAADSMGAEIITFDNERYPERLRNIMPPPYILYAKGKIDELDSLLAIGVVGTRRYSDYGKLVTHRIAADLAKNGVVTVTGLARGVDGEAARSALRSGGLVIGVLGSGLDVPYPPEHKQLIDEVAASGMLISEYPPGAQALRGHFPERNRIIAGLSNGVLVTEAPKGSGALITARLALEYGRDVFAVPGDIFDSQYAGSNRLIQMCAKLTQSVQDILEEYPYAVKRAKPSKTAENAVPVQEEKPSITENLNDDERRIVTALTECDKHVDELSRELDMNAGELNIKLTVLEMKAVIKKLPGGIYRLNV